MHLSQSTVDLIQYLFAQVKLGTDAEDFDAVAAQLSTAKREIATLVPDDVPG